ncbi:MAG: condensation domain-containing protein [Chloroflexota bacterium]
MTSNANHNHHSKSELFQQIISSFEDPKDLVDAIESKKEQRRITLRQGQSGQLPQNTTEMWLSKVWHDILAVPLVYRDDDFFHLGGNSLQAIQVVSRIRQEYYVELPLQQFFEHRTLGAMASAVQNLQTAVPGSTQPPLDIAHISTRPNQSVHPLSFSQERLWFLTQLEPASSLYNIPLAVQLDGEANQLALEASLDAIWQRHEALRARFFNMDGVTKQQITPFRSFPLSVVDLQTVQRPTALVQSFIQAEVDHQFDLAQEDLLRVVLLRLAPDKHILLMTLHHIVADRWSLGVIARELVAAYQAYIQSGQIRLPDLPIQYADFAHWQFNWLQGAELERQRTYWQAQLAQCPPTLPLPTDMPRPAKPTYLIDKRMMRLSVSLSEAIKQLSRQQGCTLFMTLLAAFNILLARYTRQTDMAVGTFTANRNRAEIEDLIGYFVNTLTLRTDLSGQPTFVELLTRVREVTLGAYAHQDFPFKLVLEALNPDRNLAQNPLFQVMLVLQNTPLSSVDLPNLDVTYLPIENQLSNMDLTLWVHEESKGLDFALEYNASLFKPETIDQMLMHFQTLLEYVVADPYQPIEMYSILTSTERARLLTEFSAGPALLWPMAFTLNQLF